MTALLKSILVSLAFSIFAQPALADDGIAGKYVQDKGIENDPAVVFSEKFDAGSIDAIVKRWGSVKHKEILYFVVATLAAGPLLATVRQVERTLERRLLVVGDTVDGRIRDGITVGWRLVKARSPRRPA